MNPNYFRPESGSRQSNLQAFDAPGSQTERPTTPVYLMQQSNEEQYRHSLVENLTGYLSSPEAHNESELNSYVLPKDVNYYFHEEEKVQMKVAGVFERERGLIEGHFDDFLKQILLLCEEKKNELFALLEQDHRDFAEFYGGFKQEVRGFLNDAQSRMQASMNSFSSVVGHMREDYMNPLEYQMHLIQLRKKHMDNVEATIRTIHNNYNHSPIPEQKRVLERLLIDQREGEPSAGGRRT